MSNYIIPLIFLAVFFYAFIKKIPLYSCFADGIKQACKLVFDIFPYITAIFIAVELLNVSGISDLISNLLAPIFDFFQVPKQLARLVILRPLSGNGSLAMLNEIYILYGADSILQGVAQLFVALPKQYFISRHFIFPPPK